MRLINERFASVMGECVIWTPHVRHQYSVLSTVLQPWRECCRLSIEDVKRTPRVCSGTVGSFSKIDEEEEVGLQSFIKGLQPQSHFHKYTRREASGVINSARCARIPSMQPAILLVSPVLSLMFHRVATTIVRN